jgi:hypothetical protein
LLNYPYLIYNLTPTTCGQSNGAIDLFVDPPTGTTIQWDNGATTEDLSNLAAGDYGVTVTAANGCSIVDNMTIQNGGTTFDLSATTTPNTACAAINGAVNLSVAPAGNYTYVWSNNMNSQDLQNVGAGTYTVTVSAGGNCTATASYTVPNNSAPPSLTITTAEAICGLSNGGVYLTASPAGNYTYQWSNGATTEDLPSVGPNSYSVTVTNANGCSNSTIAVVPNFTPNIPFSTTVTPNFSCLTPDGSLDLTMGLPGSYTYTWSNGASTQDLQNLAPGSYTVTVTQGVNCTQSTTYEVLNNTASPISTAVATPASCGLSTGAIDLSVTPVNGNAFSWSNGATSEDLQNLAPGSYSVTITGANGCSSIANANVADTPTNFFPTGISIPNTSCTTYGQRALQRRTFKTSTPETTP